MNMHAVLLSWFDESICTWLEQAPFGLILVNENARVVWANFLQSAFTEHSPQQLADLPLDQVARLRACHLDQAANLVLKSGSEWQQKLSPQSAGTAAESMRISILPVQRKAQVRGAVVLFSHPHHPADFAQAHQFLLERLSSLSLVDGGGGDSAEGSYIAFQRQKEDELVEKYQASQFKTLIESDGKIWPVRQLVAAKQEAQRRLLKVFCHDLSNVLMPLLQYIRQLEPMEQKPGSADVVDLLDRQGKKVINFLQSAKKLIKEYQPDLKPVPWSDLLHAAYDRADLHCTAPKPSPRFDLQKNLPPFFGSSAGLLEAFSAILLNALDAVDEKGKVSVTLRYEEELDRYLIVVVDDGVGISAEIMANIFDAYYTTKSEERVGLGLAIAYRVIQSHQGMIQIKSELNRGTEVRVTLPAKHDALPRVEKPSSMEPQNRPTFRRRR